MCTCNIATILVQFTITCHDMQCRVSSAERTLTLKIFFMSLLRRTQRSENLRPPQVAAPLLSAAPQSQCLRLDSSSWEGWIYDFSAASCQLAYAFAQFRALGILRDLGIFGPLACIHPLYKEVWIIIFELAFRSAVSTDIDRLWSDVSHVQDLHLRLSPLNLIGCLNLPAKSSVSHVGWKQATVVYALVKWQCSVSKISISGAYRPWKRNKLRSTQAAQ